MKSSSEIIGSNDMTRPSLHIKKKVLTKVSIIFIVKVAKVVSGEMAQSIKDFHFNACLPAMLLASHTSLTGDHPTNERPCLKGGGYHAG